jgi:hypothetical protein
MRKFNRAMRHPLFPTVVAIWFVVIAWQKDWWTLGFAAGVMTAMAINDWSDWYFDRWKEKYRERTSREG